MFPPRDRLTICFAHVAYQLQERFARRRTGLKSVEARSREALMIASDRVKAKYGHACSLALGLHTKRIKLGTAITNIYLRHPNLLANEALKRMLNNLVGDLIRETVRRGHAGGVLTLEDVRDYLASTRLEKFKWPEALVIIDEFPRTASGKVRKEALRSRWIESEARETA